MSTKRSNPSRPSSANKVFWSEAEKLLVIQAAVDTQRERPELSGLPLLRAATAVLPAGRRRKFITMGQAPWFEPGVRAEIRRRADESPDDANARDFTAALLRMIVIHEDWESKHEEAFAAQHKMFAEIRDELRRQTELIEQFIEKLDLRA